MLFGYFDSDVQVTSYQLPLHRDHLECVKRRCSRSTGFSLHFFSSIFRSQKNYQILPSPYTAIEVSNNYERGNITVYLPLACFLDGQDEEGADQQTY